MLNIIGKVKVTGIKRDVKVVNGQRKERVTGSVYQGVKVGKNFDGSDKWSNEFVKCRFVGDSLKLIDGVVDKDKIEITQGVLRAIPLRNGVFHEIVIFNFIIPNDEPLQEDFNGTPYDNGVDVNSAYPQQDKSF